MAQLVEFGLTTFGEITIGRDGRALPHAQVIRDVILEAILADQVGMDFFGVGEHHRSDYAISAPEVVLAAIAGRTNKIRLGSAVTVLGSDDPIRVFQRFATLNAVTNGRAEVVLGRGWFTESYRLFGFDLAKHDELFSDKLGIFVALTRRKTMTRDGKVRSSLTGQDLFPPIVEGNLKTWLAVGASAESVLRAVRYDLSLMIAVIGGEPERFSAFTNLYRSGFEKLKKAPRDIGIHSSGYIADTDEKAHDEFWPAYRQTRDALGAERGWPPITVAQFNAEVGRGSLYVGSPETVARKIAKTVKTLGISRFALKYGNGLMMHDKLLRNIELYGTKVVPLVKDILSR